MEEQIDKEKVLEDVRAIMIHLTTINKEMQQVYTILGNVLKMAGIENEQ